MQNEQGNIEGLHINDSDKLEPYCSDNVSLDLPSFAYY